MDRKLMRLQILTVASRLHLDEGEVLEHAMKTTLFFLLIFCAAAAFGQTAGVLPNQPNIMELPEHPQHASQHAMAAEQSLVGGGSDTYTYAHGERPLWEFGPVTQEPSLGDIARENRKEKMAAKKAEIVFEKQGS
jgi:hypothetical protein